MKKLRLSMLAIAAVAMVGMFACTSSVKNDTTEEVVEEVVEQVVEEVATVVDTVAVADTVAIEAVAEETEVPAE